MNPPRKDKLKDLEMQSVVQKIIPELLQRCQWNYEHPQKKNPKQKLQTKQNYNFYFLHNFYSLVNVKYLVILDPVRKISHFSAVFNKVNSTDIKNKPIITPCFAYQHYFQH